MNIFYNVTGIPVARSRGLSSPVRDEFGAIEAGFDLVAPIASPAFTGVPTAPTPTNVSDDSTKIATTAFVQEVLGAAGSLLPPQATHLGKALFTNGVSAAWEYDFSPRGNILLMEQGII